MNEEITSYYRKYRWIPVIILLIAACFLFISQYTSGYTLTTPVGTETNITTLTPDSNQLDPSIYSEWVIWTDNQNLYSYNVNTGNETILREQGDISTPTYPRIEGNRIVWQSGNTSTTYDIRLYDILSGENTKVAVGVLGTLQPELGPRPDISGDYIVWQEINASDIYDIWLYKISTQKVILIAEGVPGIPFPRISGNHVVWQAFNTELELSDIYIYNITESPVLFISGIFEPPMPAIDGNTLVWQAINITQLESTGDMFFDILYIPDISASSTYQLVASDVPYFYPAPNPLISGGNIVWQDWRNSNLDIYLFNISSDELMPITSDPTDQVNPAIYGNRILWTDYRNTFADIFMYTLGTETPCPVADFTATPEIGSSPLTVQFNDTSTGNPETWTWMFGDGNISREQNPTYPYTAQGSYTVSLMISTPECRNAVQKENLITVGVSPTADFSATPLSGYVPLKVNFTDLSTGSPTEWNWDFGDGTWFNTTNFTDRNPTHEYSFGGIYNITLLVNNSYGNNSLIKSNYISVLEKTGITVSTTIPGLLIEQIGDRQFIAFNTSMFLEINLTPLTTLWFVPPPEYGIENMTLYSADTTGFFNDSGIIKGNISSIVFYSEPIMLEGFSAETGTDCSLIYFMNLSSYPMNGEITAYIWEGAIPSDYQLLLKVAYGADFAGITDVAYVVQLVKTNVNMLHNATIFVSVNSTWVENNGGRDKIWVIRIGDDLIGEVLPTTYIYSDGSKNLDYFRADSPRGLSKFALSALHGSGNPLQLVVLTAQQWLGGDGGGDGDGGVPIVTATPRRVPSPSTIIPETVPAPEPTSTPESLEQVTMEAPIPTPTLPVIESPPSPVPTTTTPLPLFIPMIAWVAAVGVLWLVKRRK